MVKITPFWGVKIGISYKIGTVGRYDIVHSLVFACRSSMLSISSAEIQKGAINLDFVQQ